MEESNGTPTKKKQVLFSIGSYSERNKRVINKISTNGLFSDVTLRNEQPPTREPPPRRVLRERPASLDATDSVKHTQTLPNLRKFKPLESLVDEDDHVIIVDKNGDVEKPTCPPTSSGDNVCVKPIQQPNGQVEKPSYPPKLINRSVSLDTDQLRHTGKVALTIAAYEGEPRTPTRLDFLPSQKLSRSSSKASDVSSSLTTTPLEEEAGEHIGSRLQNELTATLKRSNLKKRHDEDVETPPASPALQDSGRVEEVEIHVENQIKEEAEVPSGSVKKVATVLEKSLTFRANPEATAPTDLPQEIVEKKEHEAEEQKITQEEELDFEEVSEAPAKKEVLEVKAHEASEKPEVEVEAHGAPEKEVLEVEAHEAPEKKVLEVEAHEASVKQVLEVEAHETPVKQVLEVEAHETPEKQIVKAEAHESSSATELLKEEKKEEQKALDNEHEAVVQVEKTKVEDKVPEKESKRPENSIEKSLVDSFDEIITLTDVDTEKK